MTEICNICGKSVAWGSGKYVNRIPDFNEREIRLKMGRPFLKEILFALNVT